MVDALETTDERKFTAGAECSDAALAWLRHTCQPDSVFPAGVIHSLYYDTPPLHSYEEKRAGDFVKTKVRLRWYESGEDPGGAAFLELKRRIGRGRWKWRKKLNLDRRWLETAPLDDPRFCDLLTEAQEVLTDAFPLRPMPILVVSYTRFRFLCPETLARVCLDMNVRAGRANDRLLQVRGPADLPEVVMEMKDTRSDIPRWVEQLYRWGFRQRSFSKYGECVARLIKEER